MPSKSSALISYVKKKDRKVRQHSPVIHSHKGIPYPVSLDYMEEKEEAVNEALRLFKKGCCILWIENTVREAQDTYHLLLRLGSSGSKASEEWIGLVHSRFTQKDRNSNEENWTKRLGKDMKPFERKKRPCILVGTQVCEQSLDIDSDALFSSLCPMDFLIQRIGRLWRHREFDSIRPVGCPTVFMFGLEGSTLSGCADAIDTVKQEKDLVDLKAHWRSVCVYDPYYLGKTIEALETRTSVNIPGDIQHLLEETYA